MKGYFFFNFSVFFKYLGFHEPTLVHLASGSWTNTGFWFSNKIECRERTYIRDCNSLRFQCSLQKFANYWEHYSECERESINLSVFVSLYFVHGSRKPYEVDYVCFYWFLITVLRSVTRSEQIFTIMKWKKIWCLTKSGEIIEKCKILVFGTFVSPTQPSTPRGNTHSRVLVNGN